MMIKDGTHERYLEALLEGNRTACRTVIEEVLQTGVPANQVYLHLIWPIMAEIENLWKIDRITATQEHLATRINRTLVDQLQNKLPKRPPKNKSIVVCCGEQETHELGAQIMADMFESDGWNVKFLGGGLTNDDILPFVNSCGPDILMIYGTMPTQAPQIRSLIDKIKSINAWPDMKIMLSGGLFDRAEGLWIEIGGDIHAETAEQAVHKANMEEHPEISELRTINKRKRSRKKQPQLQ